MYINQADMDLNWARKTHQSRSAATQEQLLDAAERLLLEKSFRDLPIADIAVQAGYTVGAVYSRFRDKESLLRCLEERFVIDVYTLTDSALNPVEWQGATLVEVVSEVVTLMVRIHRARMGILREMLSRAHLDPITGDRIERAVRHVCDRLVVLVAAFRDDLDHPDPDRGVPFAFRLLMGVLKEAILFRGPGAHGIPKSDDELAAELCRAFLGDLAPRTLDEAEGS
jgi:AcrR family transcriptional regulator